MLSEVLSLWSAWDRRANTDSDNQLSHRSPGACLHVMSIPLAHMALVLWESRQYREGPLWPTKTEPPEAPADRLGRTVPHSRAALPTVNEDWEGFGSHSQHDGGSHRSQLTHFQSRF